MHTVLNALVVIIAIIAVGAVFNIMGERYTK